MFSVSADFEVDVNAIDTYLNDDLWLPSESLFGGLSNDAGQLNDPSALRNEEALGYQVSWNDAEENALGYQVSWNDAEGNARHIKAKALQRRREEQEARAAGKRWGRLQEEETDAHTHNVTMLLSH